MKNEKTIELEVEGKSAQDVDLDRLKRAVERVASAAATHWNIAARPVQVKAKMVDTDGVPQLQIEIMAQIGKKRRSQGWRIGPASRGMVAQLFSLLRYEMKCLSLKFRRL